MVFEWAEPFNEDYCESKNGFQYVNVITSIIAAVAGTTLPFLMETGLSTNRLLYIILCALATHAIAGAGHHWTGQFGWANVSGSTLMFSSTMMFFAYADEVLFQYLVHARKRMILYQSLSPLLGIFSVGYALVGGVLNDLADQSTFRALVIIPIVGIVLIAFLHVCAQQRPLGDQESDRKARNTLWVGILVSFSSTVFWLVTEEKCDDYAWLQYAQGHGIFNLCLPLGFFWIIAYCLYSRGVITERDPVWTFKFGVPVLLHYERASRRHQAHD